MNQPLPPAPLQPAPVPPHGHPAPVRPGTNGWAISSLIFGLLGGVLLGIVFGVIALVQIRKRPQGGRRLAIAGIVASGVWALIFIAIITVAVVAGLRSEPVAAPRNPAPAVSAASPADPGKCVSKLKNGTSVENLPTVPCSRPHAAEVYATFEIFDGGLYPGAGAVKATAEQGCRSRLRDVAGDRTDTLTVMYLAPSRETWDDNRNVTCVATDPKGPMTGSLRD